jgi:L-lactate dehydrogenase complex protein LldG
MNTPMTTRDRILNKLHTTLARPDLRFPLLEVEPLTADMRMTVTSASGGKLALARRFGDELQKLHGEFEIVESAAEARMALISRLQRWVAEEAQNAKGVRFGVGFERQILSWHPDALPVPGLAEALHDLDLTLVTPEELRSPESRAAVRYIRYGLTGVEAAFASTGSLLVASGPQTPRSASLLPIRHIALIPFARLYPTMEHWLRHQRETGTLTTFLRSHANVTMISGPSKSADIEMNLTLGVHGPRYVYAILFGREG